LRKIEKELFPKNFFYRHSKLVAPDLIGCHLINKNNEIDQVKGLLLKLKLIHRKKKPAMATAK